MLKRKKERKK